ncbi:6189_t:CDS:2 [Funneliformis geosporum]|uniref:6189_t:CDS:1 n=1 Tax=Funneliformis geosporum TaxID=1117311 RepID=A0A9W4WQF0_9GLOM|nr:6189_t:CDS:2 [Funneliformis geosporum]
MPSESLKWKIPPRDVTKNLGFDNTFTVPQSQEDNPTKRHYQEELEHDNVLTVLP